MNDDQLWDFERELWVGGREAYDRQVDPQVTMALPAKPFLYDESAAIAAVKDTPVWERADFEERRVERHGEDLIVIGYRVSATRGEQDYRALCTSVIRRGGEGEWRVIQHQQTPFGMEVATPDDQQ